MHEQDFLDRFGEQMQRAKAPARTMAPPISESRRTARTRRRGALARRGVLVGALAAIVAVGGVGGAVAVTSWNDPDKWPVVVASPGPTDALPTPDPPMPQTPQLREGVIARVGFLREGASAADAVPAALVPKSAPGSPLKLSEKDLEFARKVPGSDATWVVPLPTGALMIIEPQGGAVFTPGQLDAGEVVSSNPNKAGENVVTGVVPDGTKSVSVDTGNGESVSLEVRDGGYSAKFPGGVHPRTLDVERANGTRTSIPLTG